MVNVTEIQKNFQSPNPNYMVKLTKNKKIKVQMAQFMVKITKNKKKFLSPKATIYGKNYQKYFCLQ